MGVGDIQTNRLDVLVKRDFAGIINRLFQESTVLTDELESVPAEGIDTKGIEFLMNVEAAGPNAYTPEGGVFPDPKPLDDVRGRVRHARLQRTITYSGDSWIHFTKLSDSQIIEKMSGRVERDTKTSRKDHEQMLFGDGTGEVARVIAPIPGGATNATVTFAQSVANGNTFGSYKIRKGARYQFYTAAGVARAGAGVTSSKVVSVNKKLGTAVFDSLPNTAGTPDIIAGDRLIPVGSYTFVPYGLDYFFATTGVRQNLSLDVYDTLRATIIDAGGQFIGPAILTRLKYAMSYRVDWDQLNNLSLLWSPAQEYGYNLQGQTLKRAANSDSTYKGGYKDTQFEDQMAKIAVDAPRDTVYRMPKGTIKRAELYPYGPLDIEGLPSVHLAWAGNSTDGSGTHAFRLLMYMFWAGNNYCPTPNVLAAIRGLSLDGLPLGNDD